VTGAPREAPASGATVVIVLGATAAVVVGLWAAGREGPRSTDTRAEWMTAAPTTPPATPPAPAAPRAPVTEPLQRAPTEVLGQGGTSTIDADLGRLCVRDASGQVIYEARFEDMLRGARVNPPDRVRHVEPSVDLADGRRVVVSDEVWLRLPLERRYTHETGPPAEPAPRDAAPTPSPIRRGP
jgi:hypothetical protein